VSTTKPYPTTIQSNTHYMPAFQCRPCVGARGDELPGAACNLPFTLAEDIDNQPRFLDLLRTLVVTGEISPETGTALPR
jgi:hypothetical protein